MVFIGGPRQVGKTTMSQHVLKNDFSSGQYFNWDFDEHRQAILAKKWSKSDQLLVFDEIHKFQNWKNWLKGIYDIQGDDHSILVTGSARLDVYQRGGDSMLGRYHYWRLHPFTLDELPNGINYADGFNRLMTVGGFPETFLSGDERLARRWRRERLDRIVREDIRDLESIRHISHINLLIDLLRTRVGSPVVISNLANDLQVSPNTVKSWLTVLENMYLIFLVKPYTKSLPRAIQKPPKVYFFDNGDVIGDKGAIFENLIATTLLKRLHFMEDYNGYRYELRYIRDKEGREVDFAIVRDGILQELIEAKYGDDSPSRHLKYYAQRLNPQRSVQVVADISRPYTKDNISIESPDSLFSISLWNDMENIIKGNNHENS